ncbi:AprI/Inh family metalloprotease inhibitor [Pseudovibrio sp. Tun.PSC04-5.I4]|uniref:AprI/Inh family metalloprotease inhibitor n=1 Tax=Pseudovibrio sp. Tun.PSC04-5.I4 TaxID=1798213 RepID=UPI0008837CE3|nr:AprI/Inh family metalloprotease inhibitor [Pseudovibrio sp. Tun.PSC04-5.I4]SDR37690.1 Protease inhibitor Inh [Pseudovibrio sp. Tun.PSC04-5.I4]
MKKFIIAVSLLGMAGCQGAGGSLAPPASSLSTPQATAAQTLPVNANGTPLANDETVTTKTYRRADGTLVSETTRTSAKASVDAGEATAFVAGVVAAAALGSEEKTTQPVVQSSDMVGDWTVYLKSDDRVCKLALGTTPKSNGSMAKAKNCMDGDLFFVSNWGMKGQELVLFDDFSRIKASLRMSEWNRWEGKLASNDKPITIAR